MLGLPVFTGSKQRVLIAVGDRLAEGVSTHIVTLNSEMVVNARKDPHFHRVLAGADIVVSDGIGVVWAAWILRRNALPRVPGIELAEGILRVAELAGHTVYLLGARPRIIETARERIQACYPRLRVVGSHHGYFQGQEEEVILDIVTSGARVLLVGMGSPGQEYFIARTRARLPCMVMMGIGGSYDIWAGSRRRAARWVQSLGLEWLYRAMVDFRRWRRLGFIPSFFWLVLSARFARRQAV
ncbi:MAG: hypothetical protein A2Y63_06410 [Candidatus Riflebacteria bacterium RBG_13_59_9]|nr:MAG: hypothetical protein A2Y63_06410 [Candidatus Riflebacteria bacterium RBG_13_59_9]